MNQMAYKKIFIVFIILFSINILPANQYILAQENIEQAYEQTANEFNSINSSSKEAVEKLDNILSGLREVEGRLKLKDTSKLMSNETKKTILDKLKKSRLQVNFYKKTLKNFQEKTGYVSNAFDAADAVKKFKDDYNSYATNQGELASNLFALSTAMEKFGDKIPILGDSIKAYGQITAGILGKIADISKQIDEIRNQGQISGQGFYKTGPNLSKYNILKSKFPDLAENVSYRPSNTGFVYTSDSINDPTLIWDEQNKDFYKIDAGIPVSNIFQMNLLTGRRRSPYELKVLSEKWNTFFKPINTTAEKLLTFMDKFKSGQAFEYFTDIDNKYKNIFTGGMSNNDVFKANYVFNMNYRDNLNKALSDLYNLFIEKGLSNAANQIKVFADQNGIKISNKNIPEQNTSISGNSLAQLNASKVKFDFYNGPLSNLIPKQVQFKTDTSTNNVSTEEISLSNFYSANNDTYELFIRLSKMKYGGAKANAHAIDIIAYEPFTMIMGNYNSIIKKSDKHYSNQTILETNISNEDSSFYNSLKTSPKPNFLQIFKSKIPNNFRYYKCQNFMYYYPQYNQTENVIHAIAGNVVIYAQLFTKGKPQNIPNLENLVCEILSKLPKMQSKK